MTTQEYYDRRRKRLRQQLDRLDQKEARALVREEKHNQRIERDLAGVPGHFAHGLNFYKLFWMFFICCFLGVVIETVFCLVTTGRLMQRTGLVWGPFNLIYGIGAVLLTICLRPLIGKSDRWIFIGGAVLGGAFGLTSFFNMMRGSSPMGAALFAISPAATFVLCFVSRVAMGVCCALVYRLACKLLPRRTKLCCAVGGLAAPLCNTLFFMGLLVALFYNSDYVQGLVAQMGAANPLIFVVGMVGLQGLVEAVVGCVISAAVTVPLLKMRK